MGKELGGQRLAGACSTDPRPADVRALSWARPTGPSALCRRRLAPVPRAPHRQAGTGALRPAHRPACCRRPPAHAAGQCRAAPGWRKGPRQGAVSFTGAPGCDRGRYLPAATGAPPMMPANLRTLMSVPAPGRRADGRKTAAGKAPARQPAKPSRPARPAGAVAGAHVRRCGDAAVRRGAAASQSADAAGLPSPGVPAHRLALGRPAAPATGSKTAGRRRRSPAGGRGPGRTMVRRGDGAGAVAGRVFDASMVLSMGRWAARSGGVASGRTRRHASAPSRPLVALLRAAAAPAALCSGRCRIGICKQLRLRVGARGPMVLTAERWVNRLLQAAHEGYRWNISSGSTAGARVPAVAGLAGIVLQLGQPARGPPDRHA